jgi:hypothetical protein
MRAQVWFDSTYVSQSWVHYNHSIVPLSADSFMRVKERSIRRDWLVLIGVSTICCLDMPSSVQDSSVSSQP